jgi:hypothetical protein
MMQGRLFAVNRAMVKDRGLHCQVDIGHIPDAFREDERLS